MKGKKVYKVYVIEDTESRCPWFFLSLEKPDKEDAVNVVGTLKIEGEKKWIERIVDETMLGADINDEVE